MKICLSCAANSFYDDAIQFCPEHGLPLKSASEWLTIIRDRVLPSTPQVEPQGQVFSGRIAGGGFSSDSQHDEPTENDSGEQEGKIVSELKQNDTTQREKLEITEEILSTLYELANEGDTDAQDLLGWIYYHGEGVDKDYEKAFEWFKKAAEQDVASAQFYIWKCYNNGHGVALNTEQGVTWLLKAAEQGHAEAQYGIGLYYSAGHNIEESRDKAIYWLEKSAEQGNVDAQCQLARIDSSTNAEGAVFWAEKAAEQGNSSAIYGLAESYRKGNGVEMDADKSIYWHKKNITSGDHPSYIILSYERLVEIYGQKQDAEQFVFWLKRGALLGVQRLQEMLGRYYLFVLEDRCSSGRKKYLWDSQLAHELGSESPELLFEQIVFWLTKAATPVSESRENPRGDITAQFMLGKLYIGIIRTGTNDREMLSIEKLEMKKDYKKAFYWFEKAAQQNDAEAQKILSDFYARGLGVSQNNEKALFWLEKANAPRKMFSELLSESN